ncbi:hypothetical protein ACHAXS_003811 [Conticribra weissflogii]
MKITTFAFGGALGLFNGRWRSNCIAEVEATSSRQLKGYRYQVPVWYSGKYGPPPPPPPPPHAGKGHWVFYPSRPQWDDDGHKADDDDNLKWEDDGHSDDDWTDDGWSDDGHKTASPTFSPTKSPKGKTNSPTATSKTNSPTPSPITVEKTSAPTKSWSDDGHDDVAVDDDVGDDDGWDGDGHEILKPEPEEDGDDDDNADGDDDGDGDGDDNVKESSEEYEVICFENGSPVECEGEPIGTEVYYDYRYMVELSSESRRNFEDGSGTDIAKKMESALLNQFVHLMNGDSPAMQALTRIVGAPEDEVANDEECKSATEGSECYVMVGKVSAYMAPSAAVDEKEFTCDVYSFLKHVVDYGDFSSVERLEGIEFLGSDSQYCWKEIMADSIRSTNEAEDSSTLSGGAIAGMTVAAVASLMLAFIVVRRRRRRSAYFEKEYDMGEEYEVDSIGENFSVVSEEESVRAEIVVPEVGSNEANEEEIEIQDSSILRNIDERFSIDEDDKDQLSYTSDDLVSV